MHHKAVNAKAILLAILFGASSLFAQQSNPAGVTQASASASASTAELTAKGQLDGQAAAQSVGTGGWMGGGVVTGLFTGLIGTAVIWAVAGSSDVSVPADRKVTIAAEPSVYQSAYESSYGQKLKSRRKGAALGGGLIGTAAFVLLYISASSGSSQ